MVKLKRFLKPYREAGAVHALFAPHRFIDDQVFLTKSNQLGVVIAVDGLDDECLIEATLETNARRMAAAWRALDEQFRIYQYAIKQEGAELPAARDYPTDAVRSTVEARHEFLRTKSEGLYQLLIVWVILYEPQSGVGGATWKRTLSNRKVLRVLADQLERNRAVLLGHVESLRRTLGDLVGLRVMAKAEAFQFFRLLANLDPEAAGAERLKFDGHVDYFLPSVPVACVREGVRIGQADVEVLSLREPPAQTFPNALRELLRLESNFILCSEYKRVTNESAITKVREAQNHFHWSQWVSDLPSILSMMMSRGNRENVIADKTALNDVEDLDKTLARIKNDGESLGEFSMTAVLYGWGDRPKLQRAAADVIKILGNHEGSLIRETYNALNAYLSIMPGNNALNLRRTWLLSSNYADLAFAYAPSRGETRNRHLGGEQLVVLETNDATPYFFNLQEGDRLGALIFGAPGAGKSVLANLLIDHSQKDAPRTFILDLGGSYRQITRKHDGSYLHLEFGSGRQSFRINPFSLHGSADNIQFLFTLVRLLLTQGGYQPTAADDQELFEAVESMYVFDRELRRLGNLAHGLPPYMAPYLAAWVGHGQYASLFDNVDDTLTFAEFQTFDFQGMDEVYPQLMEPLLFYIFQRISQVVYDPVLSRTPKQLWADEVWRFLANDTARMYLVAAGKTWRKHNGGIGLITQSAADLQSAGILDLVNEVCPTKILLANSGADAAAYQRMFKLNEREAELFATLIPKRQFLWKTAQRSKVLNVNLDPAAYWQYTNSPYDNERRRQAIEQHGFEEGLRVLAAEAKV